MKDKNNYIELLRFIFCMIIVLHHSGFVSGSDSSLIFVSGSLGADFFYLVTGYLTVMHVMNRREQIDSTSEKMGYSLRYTITKLKKVFLYAACGSILVYVLNTFLSDKIFSLKNAIFDFQSMPFEMLFMPMAGVMPIDLYSYRNAPMWYISTLLVVLPIVMYIAIKSKDVFKNYIVWFVPPLIMGYMVYSFETVTIWGAYTGFIYAGVLRALADLLMGASVYFLADIIAKRYSSLKTIGRLMFTACELVLLVITIYYCTRTLNGYDQIFTIYLMMLLLSITASGVSYTKSLPFSGFFGLLGKLSMTIYCLHWAIYQYVEKFMKDQEPWTKVAITFAICIAISVMLMGLTKLLKKKD